MFWWHYHNVPTLFTWHSHVVPALFTWQLHDVLFFPYTSHVVPIVISLCITIIYQRCYVWNGLVAVHYAMCATPLTVPGSPRTHYPSECASTCPFSSIHQVSFLIWVNKEIFGVYCGWTPTDPWIPCWVSFLVWVKKGNYYEQKLIRAYIIEYLQLAIPLLHCLIDAVLFAN
jgi:hypothetical protein